MTTKNMSSLVAAMVAALPGEQKAKDIWEYANSVGAPKLMAFVRKNAKKVRFGVFQLDESLTTAALAKQTAKPTKKAATAVKSTATAPKKGKREVAQEAQLTAVDEKASVGQAMYLDKLIEKGAKKVSREDAVAAQSAGSTSIYAVDTKFDNALAMPPLPADFSGQSGDGIEFYIA